MAQQENAGVLVGGVSLVQVSAVHAAMAEGFELTEVLDVEQLPSRAWFEAEVSWKARFAADEAEMSRYAEELARQQDRLARRVAPLEDNLEAWVTFLRFYESHRDPFDLLSALGIGFNDLSRLSRRWNARFDEEPKLTKDAAKLNARLDKRLEKGDKLLPPVITVAEPVLSPSAEAGHFAIREAEVTTRAAAAPAPTLGLDRYAALSAELRTAPQREHDKVLQRFGLSATEAIAIDEAWRARLESDRELQSDFRVLSGHYEQQSTLRRRSAVSGPPPAGPSPVVVIPRELTPLPITPPPASPRRPPLRTAPMAIMAHVSGLPFQGAVSAVPPIAATLPPRAAGDGIDTTGDIIPALRDSDATPFESIDVTAIGVMAIVDDPLPFSVTPASLASLSITPEISIVSGSLIMPFTDGPANLVITLTDEDIASFDPENVDSTSDVIPALRDSDATPFERLPPRSREEVDRTTVMGIAALSIDDEPQLSIEQLASLHAEILVQPNHADAIRLRYHLATIDAQRQEESAWYERFDADPELRTAYDKKLLEFRAWLLRNRH